MLSSMAEEMHKHPNIHLLWVGDGYWATRLLKRVEELGIKDRVHAPGLVTPETIPAWARAMDVVVHPSYREGLPRAVVQGLLSARPVVAYDLDGAPEVCIPGETGFLVKPGDVIELRRAINTLREDPALASTLGDRGREHCRVAYDWREMVQKLQAVYEDILGSTHA